MLISLYRDKDFIPTTFKLAMPIILQHLVIFALGMVDVVMIGQLGDTAVAAVGLADQIFFVLILTLFGVSSGAAIFTAQFWGKKDIVRIHSTLGLCLLMSLLAGLIFSGIAVFIPAFTLSIYSTDPAVVAQGSGYLQIVGLSYAATAVTVAYSAVLRSTENVKLPLVVSLLALSFNTLFNYGLIFGNFGLPALGVNGAAIATCAARFLEAIILLAVIYRSRLPVAATLPQMFNFKVIELGRFFKTTLPVVLTEVCWSLGVTTYNIVYARIGTEAIAAVNIAVTIDRLLFVIFIGMSNASAIMIGNRIGANEPDRAFIYAKRFVLLGPLGAVFVGLLVLLTRDAALSMYQVSPLTIDYARNILMIMALSLSLRVANMILLIGVLRSGGDTSYAFFVDAGAIWVIGVPLAFTGAFVLNLPIYWVYLLVLTEEVVKLSLGLYRMLSLRWIHNLAVPA